MERAIHVLFERLKMQQQTNVVGWDNDGEHEAATVTDVKRIDEAVYQWVSEVMLVAEIAAKLFELWGGELLSRDKALRAKVRTTALHVVTAMGMQPEVFHQGWLLHESQERGSSPAERITWAREVIAVGRGSNYLNVIDHPDWPFK